MRLIAKVARDCGGDQVRLAIAHPGQLQIAMAQRVIGLGQRLAGERRSCGGAFMHALQAFQRRLQAIKPLAPRRPGVASAIGRHAATGAAAAAFAASTAAAASVSIFSRTCNWPLKAMALAWAAATCGPMPG